MPARSRFHTRSGYYTTKLHELIHWTGHPKRKKRTDPKNPKHFDKKSEEYAAEELVAELGSCFLLAHLGLPEHLDEMPNHASYIDHWIKLLQDDDRAIWRAAAKAGGAVTFIIGKPKKKKKLTKKQRSQAARRAWETRRRKQQEQECQSTSL
jgi:antirestriction protein ArdC